MWTEHKDIIFIPDIDPEAFEIVLRYVRHIHISSRVYNNYTDYSLANNNPLIEEVIDCILSARCV